ncbi:hypothetical protein PgNI_06443 [Pyricularia grisea]|uniref:Cyanovirin-N domain-containing protein n=1 Tax=Pyricularia grisea TaxID=148305 RepID=A0A6P8B3W7_PYRGI|nr:hypothetical protein PgNI_06443 [Pyricularia grisea]TLD09935.1 hypothetical protein PgNI_06443 [Pyricularia grisea]
MQLIVFLTAALAAVAQAADVCGASGSSCGGTLRCCNGIAAGSCCGFGASTSVRFTLPANSRGQAFTNGDCTGNSLTFTTANAGTFCLAWTGRGSGRWLEGRSLVKVRSDGTEASAQEECEEPNAFYNEQGMEITAREAAALESK